MEKRTKIYALILLVLCLAVPAVDANGYNNMYCYTSQPAYLYFEGDDVISNVDSGYVLDLGTEGFIVYIGDSCPSERYFQLSSGSYVFGKLIRQNPSALICRKYVYNVVESTPEPTIQPPSGAYITASVYNTGENNLYYDYNVRCMPAEGYLFAPLSFTPYSFIDGFGQRPSYTQTSEETLIQVRVFAGGDVSMYSSALNAIDYSDYQHISIVLTAPVYTAGDVVNNQTAHEELQNMPNPVNPSGGIVSGAWQPLALKQDLAVVNTPFSYIVDNYLHYFHFPEMATPETVKAELLNGTGNLTAPLYDTVDGLTSVFMIIPNYVSGVLTGLISPISETVMLVKNVILTLSDYVYNAMSVLYVFIPFIYLFIPDVIWWGLTIYLSYLVFAWLLTLLFGYDVISVFYIDPFVSWVRSRRGGE